MSRKQAAERRGRRNAETGDTLVSSLRLKVFALGNKSATLRVLKPTPGTGWNREGVDKMLDRIAEDLERRFPLEEFRLVELGPKAFNFVHVGPREVSEESPDGEVRRIDDVEIDHVPGESDGAPEVGIRDGESGKT